MRHFSLLSAVLSGALVVAQLGCARPVRHITTSAVLGRVVIYRNGVAFYERTAKVVDGRVTVLVPRDRVDDFLKSLTVIDPTTREALSVSIPRREADDGSYLTMSLETADRKQGDVLLTYVTEAPAWKPSYRVVVGADGKVMLEGWAIVDNVSGEDWNGVLVGVGASSALSFRYDLWSVRRIDRDLLQGEDRFAIAPPTGMSPYGEAAGGEEIAALDTSEVRADANVGAANDAYGASFSGASSQENRYAVDGAATAPDRGSLTGIVTDARTGEKLEGVTVIATAPKASHTLTAVTDEHGAYRIDGVIPDSYQVTFYYADTTVERSNIRVAARQSTAVYQKLNVSDGGGEKITVRASAPGIVATSTTQGVTIDKSYVKNIPEPGRTFDSVLGVNAGSSGDAASPPPPPPPPIAQGDAKLASAARTILERKRDVLIRAPGSTLELARKRAEAVKNKLVNDGIPAARIHVAPEVGGTGRIRVLAIAPSSVPAPSAPPAARMHSSDAPVGESHFVAERPMNVRAGTSAMVAMVRSETSGGIVYLYDPLSARGDERFAFKAVRLDNPTGDTLEPGPVTVYGEGRFIGEGIAEPVPPKASVVVPFALDRQIVISQNGSEQDRIARLVTVQRGVLTAEVQHRRQTRFLVTSRLDQPTKVYLRHRLESGWTLVEAPPRRMTVGDSTLFEVDLAAGETKSVVIAEATPIERRLDLTADATLDLLRVYIDEPAATPALKAQLTAVLATHKAGAELVDQIETLRDQLAEYRARSGELHAQIVTLKAVRSGGDLLAQLRTRLGEMSDRMQKTTLAIVDTQEKLMLARVKLGNQLADLRLADVTGPVSQR